MRTVPHRYNPNAVLVSPVEKAVRTNDELAMRQARKLENLSARSRKTFEPPEDLL